MSNLKMSPEMKDSIQALSKRRLSKLSLRNKEVVHVMSRFFRFGIPGLENHVFLLTEIAAKNAPFATGRKHWRVSEASTGNLIVSGTTRLAALGEAKERLWMYRDVFDQKIEEKKSELTKNGVEFPLNNEKGACIYRTK